MGRPPGARTGVNIDRARYIVSENPELSIRKLTQQLRGPSKESAWVILRNDFKLHPYQIALKQKLKDSDVLSPQQMYAWFVNEFEKNPLWVDNIWFSHK